MNISFDNALGPHAAALKLRDMRAELLARNIAHADTPGFKAQDIDFAAELSRRLGDAGATADTRIRQTSGQHLPGPSGASGSVTLRYRTPLMGSFDGNTVDTQTEQAEFARNNMQLQAALRFLDGRFKGLMNAIKGE
ncbi:MAG: flagellar basal body rod protein FlgB [Pseudomonadales bacterium]